MDNFDFRKQEEQQLQQILDETFENKGYVDQDIGDLLNDPSGTYQQMFGHGHRRESINSNKSHISQASSRKRSQSGSSPPFEDRSHRESIGSLDAQYDKHNNSYSQQQKQGNAQMFSEADEKSIPTSQAQYQQNNDEKYKDRMPQSYIKLEQYYNKYKRQNSLSEIKQKYPYFVISQPNYNLPKTYEQNIFQYNTLKSMNIQTMDVGYCAIAEIFRIAIGTDDGRVAVFQKTYTKPVNIFEAFTPKKVKNQKQAVQNNIKVIAIQWSQNLQYLAVSSNSKELKVYQFKQAITIQDKNILRICKQPMQIIALGLKQLKSSINYIKFASEIPFMALLIDQDDEMQVLQYKRHFMNDRPYLTKLPIKFNDVFQVEVADFVVGKNKNKDKRNAYSFLNNEKQYIVTGTTSSIKNSKSDGQQEYGAIMAVGSDQYVTIALLKPYFEVIMVYDKDKHGKNIKKQGYAHISFRKQPLGLLIVWDKFAQLLDIEIQVLKPLQSKIRNSGTQLMPETTLAAGLVTDTLVYQLSESGIKIYATANFGEQKDACAFKECIYEHSINFYQFPQGISIQQQLVQAIPSLQLLRLFNSFIKCSNGWLFITSNTSLFSVRIEKYQQFIRNTIENINNWKIGLQLLHDGYLGKYKNYDGMTKQVIVKNIHQYSTKYINFLQMVIDNNGNVPEWQGENSRNLLWLQQTTFLFNILIQTEQYEHLLNKVLAKLAYNNLGNFIASIQPFIMLHKLPHITQQGLQLLYSHLQNKQIISVLLIANLIPELNQIDLPHLINQIILQHKMYEEMASLNMDFKDYFTPFAVLVSHYQAISRQQNGKQKKIKNDFEMLTQLRMKSAQSQKSQKSQKSEQQKMEESLKKSRIEEQKFQEKNKLRQIISYFTYAIFRKINSNEDIPNYSSNSERKKILNKHKQFLQIFIPLFQSSIIQILLDSQQQELALFQYIIPEMFKGQSLQLINSISNKLFNTDLMTDIALNIPITHVKNHRIYWICLISLYNKSVIKMDVFMGLRYLVNFGRQSPKNIQIQTQNQNQAKKIQLQSKQSLEVYQKKLKIIKNQISSSIEKCINQTVKLSGKKIYDQIKILSPKLLEQFYNELLSPELSLQQSHIGLLRIVSLILGSGFYINVIHTMMAKKQNITTIELHKRKNSALTNTSKTSNYQNILFSFIEETIQKYDKKERDSLKNIIYENIEYFIELDCNRLCNLIIDHYLLEIDKFVNYNHLVAKNANKVNPTANNGTGKSSMNANIQINDYQFLKLIQGLLLRLESVEVQNKKVSKFELNGEFMIELRLKYLRLLAVTGRQHQILAEVKKENYPLDSSLQICKRYGIMDAQAYLLVKSGGEGEIKSAIQLYFQLIMQKLDGLTPQNLQQFKDYFISIVGQCIRVCQALHAAPDHFNEEWFLISQKLNDIKTDIYKHLAAYTGDLLCDIIDDEVYPILSQKLVKNQFSQGIIEYLRNNLEELDLSFIRVLVNQILKSFAFQKIMFLLTQQAYISSEIKERQEIGNEASQGFITNGACSICQQNEGLIIHYNNCGHEIHPSCGQDVKVCIICACRQQNMIEKQIDFLKKIKPEVYGRQNDQLINQQDKVRAKKLTKIQKLKYYDENKIDIIYI